jgi:hypothetical protein
MRIPYPEYYSGNKGERLETALYHFEKYLTLTQTPRSQWAAVGESFLRGPARQACESHAMRVYHAEHRMLRWDEFTSTLQTRFPSYNEQHTARTKFYACTQGTTEPVEAYVAHLKELAGRCTPPIHEADLLMQFSNGLVK